MTPARRIDAAITVDCASMQPSRRVLIALIAGALLGAPAAVRADTPAAEPTEDPAPFAQSRAAVRYWPVATRNAEWRTVSMRRDDGGFDGRELRRFNAPRPAARADNPTRRHVGVDLFANAGDDVIAVEDGVIIAFYPFLRARTGEMSYALLVAHNGYVANYGEVRGASLSALGLSIGDNVRAGQRIGAVSDTRQLHFETYLPGATRSQSWRHGAPRPSHVLNPTHLLLDLAQNGRRLGPGDSVIAATH